MPRRSHQPSPSVAARARAVAAILRGVRGVQRVTGRAMRIAHAMLDPEVADALSARTYARQTGYRAPWHQELGLFDFELSWLEVAALGEGARVLVLGAGAGREAIALTRRGLHVTAVERTASMVASGRAHPDGGEVWVEADVRELDAHAALAGPFDAVILGWGLYGHLLSRQARVDLLRAVRARTRGPVLLSWRDAPRRGLVGDALSVGAVRALREGRARAPEPTLVTNLVGTVCVFLSPEHVREEAEEAGLRLVRAPNASDTGYPCAHLSAAD